MVGTEARVDQTALLVVDHLLTVGEAEYLLECPLHLPRGGNRVDHPSGVGHHQHPLHGDLPGLGVHRHLDELSSEWGRALVTQVGSAGDDLVLILLMQAAQGHLLQCERGAIGCKDLPVAQLPPPLSPSLRWRGFF